MLCRVNTLCFLLAAVLLAAPARAQLSTDDALAIFREVEAAMRDGSEPEARPALAGAEVVLRAAGRVVGRGTSVSGPDAHARALEAAIENARARLEDRYERARPGIALSLELTGRLIPIPDSPTENHVARLSPGYDGVAVRIGERTGAVFPGAMITTGATHTDAYKSVFTELTGDAGSTIVPLDELRARHEGVLYRFRTLHLAQGAPGEIPVFLVRGGRLVTEGMMDTDEIVRTCDGIASNLAARYPADPESLAMPGVYHAVSGRSEPGESGLRESLVAAYALVRYASTPGIDPGTGVDARVRALELLQHASERTGELERDPVTASFALLAATEAVGELGAGGAGSDPASALIFASRKPLLGAYDPARGFARGLSAPSFGAVALGLVVLAESTGELDDIARAQAAVGAAYGATAPGELVSQMPWLGWADIRLGTLTGDGASGAVALRDTRRLAWDHQIASRPDEPDLVGGIVYSRSENARPNWHTLRPVGLFATMLADPALTGADERLDEVSRLVRAARFVRQLCADRLSGMLYRDADRAMWGVREAVWSSKMPPDAASLALLTMTELVRSLETVSQADAGP